MLLFLSITNHTIYASELSVGGEIKYPTCQVKINNVFNSPVISLPTISVNDLKDSSLGETNFELKIYDCLRSMTQKQVWDVRFSPHRIDKVRDNPIPGYIPMKSGTAKDIGLQLLEEPSGTPISNWNSSSGKLYGYRLKDAIQIPPGQAQGSHTFAVRYLPLSKTPKPGTLKGVVQYAISYY
jgi:Fimbrial protein.